MTTAQATPRAAAAGRWVAAWRAKGRLVDREVLPRSDRLPHDLIDLLMPVYPVLLEIASGQRMR